MERFFACAVILNISLRVTVLPVCCMFTFNGGVLVGQSYKTVVVMDWYDCLCKCINDHHCLSYNYKTKGDYRICDLNSCGFRSRCDAEKVLIKDPRFVFHQLEKIETKSICQVKETNPIPTEGPKQAIQLAVSCSQRLQVFIDGKMSSPGYLSCFLNTTFVFKLNSKPQLIALEGTDDTRGQPGLVASLDNDVTDTSWKCTTDARNGWQKAHFDDLPWPNAISYCNNTSPRWPLVTALGVRGNAEWIWTDQSVVSRHVYCRKILDREITPFTKP